MSYARQPLDTYPRTFNLDAGVLAATVDTLTDCAGGVTKTLRVGSGELHDARPATLQHDRSHAHATDGRSGAGCGSGADGSTGGRDVEVLAAVRHTIRSDLRGSRWPAVTPGIRAEGPPHCPREVRSIWGAAPSCPGKEGGDGGHL